MGWKHLIGPGSYPVLLGHSWNDPIIVGKEIILWCEEPDRQALEQLVSLTQLPNIFFNVCGMADLHGGYGMPIGGVVAVKDIILPYAVGNDIGCFTGDTKIALLDGKTKTFKEQLNKKFWIYSISDDNMIIPGFAECIKTRENAQLVEIEIDNCEKIKCTPDQLFKMRNGEYKEAQYLKPDDSLMPLYLSYQKRDGYEILHNPGNRSTLTHRIVAESIFGPIPDNFVVHHINKNKYDNRPENIIIMEKNKHNSLHGKEQIKRLQSNEFKKHRLNILKEDGFYDKKYHTKKRNTAIENIINYMKNNPEKFKEDIKNNGQRGKQYLINYNKSEKGRLKSKEIANRYYKCNICDKEIKSPIGLYNHKRKEHNNHKVISVQFLKEKEDVYCLRVNNQFNNFALASGVFVHNCGMFATKLDFLWQNLKPKKIIKIMEEAMRVIPHGTGVGHRIKQKWDKFDLAPEFPSYIKAALETAEYQLGSLGAGNHFIELLKGDDGYVWLMIHSGSRNLGANICTEFYHRAKRFCDENNIKPPTAHLSYLPLDHDDGIWYYDMMNFALDFAKENRRRMMTVFESIACGMLGCGVEGEIDIHHNYANFEDHINWLGDIPQNVLVHRKGATPAFEGQFGVIPGSMGTSSYIVQGKSNPASLCTVSHGAGRAMSRSQAKKKFRETDTRSYLTERGIWFNHIALDEDPRCYKDINKVIAAQDDLVDVVVKLDPLGVIIGT